MDEDEYTLQQIFAEVGVPSHLMDIAMTIALRNLHLLKKHPWTIKPDEASGRWRLHIEIAIPLARS